MVGTTLREIRTAIEQHASGDGDYYIVCARTGDRPVPVADRRFPTLPIGVELLRRTATATPAVSLGVRDATALGDGDWRLVLTTATSTEGLVCIRPERTNTE